MARKLKAVVTGPGQRWAKVYRDAEWEEWQVEFYIHAERQEGATYHTDDKADAIHNARYWASMEANVLLQPDDIKVDWKG